MVIAMVAEIVHSAASAKWLHVAASELKSSVTKRPSGANRAAILHSGAPLRRYRLFPLDKAVIAAAFKNQAVERNRGKWHHWQAK
jgi:hypothetical protein